MYGKEIRKIILSNNPDILANAIYPSDTKEQCKKKNKKQFKTLDDAWLLIILKDNKKVILYAPKYYNYDGATIPFNVGKGDMKLLIPALFHDIMCDNKALINYDRKLADTIFLKLLLMNHKHPIIAYIMFFFVEVFQSLFRDWRNN